MLSCALSTSVLIRQKGICTRSPGSPSATAYLDDLVEKFGMIFKRQFFQTSLVLCLVSTLIITALVPTGSAQTTPGPTSLHVTDNAVAIDATIRHQVENILTNLQLRSGINFAVVTVKTTAGRDIYDYSFDLAKSLDIGLRTSSNKSLLLVVAMDDKLAMTQFSKGVSKQIPEGALGELSQRLIKSINRGSFSEGLLLGLQQFVLELAGKMGFSTEGLDQEPPAKTGAETNVTAPAETARIQPPVETPTPSETPAPPVTKQIAKSTAKPSPSPAKKKNTPEDDEAEADAVGNMQTHAYAARVVELREFIDTHPESKSKAYATELLVSSRAALGDEKLLAGDREGGLEQLRLAIEEAPLDLSDKLYTGVITQIPFNLYLRNERTEAFTAAKTIETKFGSNAKHLLSLSGFYLRIERGDEATRLAEQATKLAPDLAAAYDALGLALHISLRLDQAMAAYKRALELDPKTPVARRSLPDLNRAAGKATEALAAYREQLAADPTDRNARAGLVLALYEAGQTEDADKELGATLKDNPRNVTLMASVAYWLLAHNDNQRGLELAKRAADIEPRYTWGQIALARALIADRSAPYAEACLRFARQHGRFPTLEYELANALAAMGLYEEAADTLSQAFTLKDGFIETELAGRFPARSESFIELLAPERRASIFQAKAADTNANARMLKALLSFTQAISSGSDGKIDEAGAVTAAREFADGTDDLRAYRQLYAADRLLKSGVGFGAAKELADAARSGVDAAILSPVATIAVQADELHDIRARSIAAGGTPDMPEAPRNVLANLLRGRIEDVSGWASFNQDQTSEAIKHLRLAIGITPEGTPLWRAAVWHLATALDQNGDRDEALGYYIKSYNAGPSDTTHRATIEQLYRKVNGSLEGLDDRIGPAQAISSAAVPAVSANPNTATEQLNTTPAAVPTPAPTPTPEPVAEPTPSPEPVTAQPSPASSPIVEATPAPSPENSPTPEAAPTPEPSPTPGAGPSPSPETPAVPVPPSTSSPTPPESPSPSASPAASPAATPASETRPRRVKPPNR
jgi:tetratricopeptide (TPR) repeat protein/uncharacterized membrane protein YgcG